MVTKSKSIIKGLFMKIYNSHKLRSLHFLITSSFTIITVIAILIVSIALYNKFSLSAEQNAKVNTTQIVDQVNLNLDYYFNSMLEISNLLDISINKKEEIPNSPLQDQIGVILNTRKDLVSVAIFSDTGELIMGAPFSKLKDNAKVTEQEWFKIALDEQGNQFFSTPHVQSLYEGMNNSVVSLSRSITFYRNGKWVKGVLLEDMNFREISQMCGNVSLGKKGFVYLVDSKGDIIYNQQLPIINMRLRKAIDDDIKKYSYGSFFEKDKDGSKLLININTVSYTRWKIVGVAYMDELVASYKDISSFIEITLFLVILLIIVIFILISSKITQPIKQLEKSMKLVEEGNFDISINIKGEDEVVRLSRTFNLMISKIKQLMDQIVVEQEAKRKSELNALQSQINPHFLYNTLDSVVWMAENEKSQDVITMVTALARLFRISISRGRNIITVKEEIEHAKNYLIIQKIRYKNKFQYSIFAEPEALQCLTLKLILQPLIENAIYHGIEYMVDEGFINISVKVVGDKLLYEISDNGLGMKKEVLEHVLEYESKAKEGSGVGVKNVHERIQLCYGKEYGLQVESELEEGTNIKIWIPIVKS